MSPTPRSKQSPSSRKQKAGSSGLFHASAIAAALLIALTLTGAAEPLAVELTEVAPGLDERTHQPIIFFKMTADSARLFAEFTAKNVGRPMEVRIDGKAIMTPVVREPILGGRGQVTSSAWTLRETQDIVDRLLAGKARIEFEIVDDK
jgi:preprotein translocase subunit SecD